jgi:hypothetical protein
MPILTSPRFSFEPPRLESEPMRRVRAAWISDVHLGTRGSNAAALLDFLRNYEAETLHVVGDLIDIWQLRRSRYWPQQHNDVIQKILRKARKGTRIITSRAIMTTCCPSFMAITATLLCKSTPSTV